MILCIACGMAPKSDGITKELSKFVNDHVLSASASRQPNFFGIFQHAMFREKFRTGIVSNTLEVSTKMKISGSNNTRYSAYQLYKQQLPVSDLPIM